MILLGRMSNKNLFDKNIGLLGLPYVIKQAFGNTTGNVFLADTALAIFVCWLAVQTATIRMLFSMARDNRLPFGSAVARVSGRRKVPIVPALVTGILALGADGDQRRQPERIPGHHVDRDHHVLPGLSRCDGADAARRLRGDWPRPDHGPYFSLGRWGLLVNACAVVYGTVVAFNIAWPRNAVYNPSALRIGTGQFGRRYLFIGGRPDHRHAVLLPRPEARSPIDVLAEHRADLPPLPARAAGESAP